MIQLVTFVVVAACGRIIYGSVQKSKPLEAGPEINYKAVMNVTLTRCLIIGYERVKMYGCWFA
jgi:hypothetical protein